MDFYYYFLREGDGVKGGTMKVLDIWPGGDCPEGLRKA